MSAALENAQAQLETRVLRALEKHGRKPSGARKKPAALHDFPLDLDAAHR